ncbi:MAG: GNAT family N-acetyltransferase [Lachnospiraceae bacterium]|nr:GNAT family N-acetyltransferase [Lachnospiraceae bacterium]
MENIRILEYTDEDVVHMIEIWNAVVEEGIAFPQEECLTKESGRLFFSGQSFCGAAKGADTGKIYGMYILHPNNVGRCGHICNASYAVAKESRGLHIGEKLVLDCISRAKELGFGILQFNAVVATNIHARHLYERIGFQQLGTIPGGFRMKDGSYEDICPYYISLV